jgi:hypothetical protein
MSKIIKFPKKPSSPLSSFWAQVKRNDRRRKIDVAMTLVFALTALGLIVAASLRYYGL